MRCRGRQRAFGLFDRGHRLEEEQINMLAQIREQFGVKLHGLVHRLGQIRTIGGAKRTEGPCDPARPGAFLRLSRARHGDVGQPAHLFVQPDPFQPVAQHGIGVGRRHRGPGREIGVMHLAHDLRLFDHHPGRPHRHRPVTRALHQFLPDRAIVQRDLRHASSSAGGISTSLPAICFVWNSACAVPISPITDLRSRT